MHIIPLFYRLYPRNFTNEYVLAVATTSADADQYRAENYDEIDRETMLEMLSRRTVTSDGKLFVEEIGRAHV